MEDHFSGDRPSLGGLNDAYVLASNYEFEPFKCGLFLHEPARKSCEVNVRRDAGTYRNGELTDF
jgi:hypothetical protein